MAVCSPGDEVLIPAPYWVSYPEMVKLAGAVPKFVLADDSTGFRLTPAQLEAAITPKTKLLLLNSPSNPTGAVYSRPEMEAIVAVAVRHNLYILSDEIYQHLVYDGAEHVSPTAFGPEAVARTIIASGFSKTYSMTGWRLGTAVAPAPIAKAMAELQSQMASNATSFAQFGALAALQGEGEDPGRLPPGRDAHRLRPPPPASCTAGWSRIPGVTCEFAGPGRLLPLSQHLELRPVLAGVLAGGSWTTAKVLAAVPGSAFGAEGYLRH